MIDTQRGRDGSGILWTHSSLSAWALWTLLILSGSSSVHNSQGDLIARSLTILGPNAGPAITLETIDKIPTFRMYDSDGHTRILAQVINNVPSIALMDTFGNVGLSMNLKRIDIFNQVNKKVVSIYHSPIQNGVDIRANTSNAVVSTLVNGLVIPEAAELTMIDHVGRSRILLTTLASGDPFFAMMDSLFHPLFVAPPDTIRQ